MSEQILRINDSVVNERAAFGKVWTDSLRHLHGEVSGLAREKIESSIRFLDNHVCVGVPVTNETGEHFGIWRECEGDRTVGLTTILESDRSLHPDCGIYLDTSRFSYDKLVQSAIIPNKRLSSRWKGLVLRHELRHGDYHMNGRYAESHECWLGEQSILREDHEIVRSLYGGDYVHFVSTAAKSLSVQMQSSGQLPCDRLEQFATQAVGEVMDTPDGSLEKKLRISTVMLDMAFTALKGINRGDPNTYAVVTKNLEGLYNRNSSANESAA